MSAHILGSYTFECNPDKMDIPQANKIVSVVKTYSGGELFQWEPILKGSQITLSWEYCSIEQYNEMKTLADSFEEVTWNPQYLGTYQVIVESCVGKYLEISLCDIAYRSDVEVVLNIRSFTAS